MSGGVRRDRLSRALARLPAPLQRLLRDLYVAARVTRDPRSFVTYLRLSRITRHTGSRGRRAELRLRPLGRAPVFLRPSTSDADTVWGTFAGRYHLPPPETGEPGLIWDLGANIGLTMADFAVRFPRARIVGVELDAENVELARANVEPWADRCELIEAAVWTEDGQIGYEREDGATAAHRVGGETPVEAISLSSLLERTGPPDYVKLDVEGAERELLREGGSWVASVGCINVEVHPPYSVEDCVADLTRLGFRTSVDPRHWACVVGLQQRG